MARLKKRHLYWLTAVILAAILAGAWIWFNQPGPLFYFSSGWVVIITLLLWAGNRFFTLQFDRLLPWSKWGNIRFFIHLTVGLVYLLLLINLTYYFIKISLTDTPPTHEQLIVMNGWGVVIFVPIFSIYFSLHFLKHWRQSELDAEKYQKETIRSQLDSLKNHLDPHFLFNNLNILASLIERNQEASSQFVHKFAEVYRSILRTKSEDLIPLSEEIEFIQAYVYLIRTRFEDNIQVHMDFLPLSSSRMLPPLTVQMLIENAVKHNIIQETTPLVIRLLQREADYLIVSNTVNKRAGEGSSHTGSGLQNIRKRYAHFTKQEVRVIESTSTFEVHIPLLEIEHA